MQTKPSSPARSSSASAPGSPLPIPDSSDSTEEEIEHELGHSAHGAQGGEKGNEYQAQWMALACLNEVYKPKDQPALQEIILEGTREPFDDIEIRRATSLTLFQSKHRQKAGSNNVTIGELINKLGKKDAFSLLKYFKGMMEILSNPKTPKDTKFIICVSAPFGISFAKDPKSKAQTNLGKNFWETSGTLQDIPNDQLEPLLSTICVDKEQQTITAYQTKHKKTKPRYARFSDEFIAGELKETGKILHDFLYQHLTNFIEGERKAKASWVKWPEKDDDKKLSVFFTKLQIWFDQPKLEELNIIILASMKLNLVLGAQYIQAKFLTAIKASSDRCRKSLLAQDIKQYLREARGGVLASCLGVHSDHFSEQYGLQYLLPAALRSEEITKFLRSDKKILLVSSVQNELSKYVAYSCARVHYHAKGSQKRFGENWFLVDYATKPLFHRDGVTGNTFDHHAEDMWYSPDVELIIVDQAHHFFATEYGRGVLRNFLKKIQEVENKQVIFISNTDAEQSWEKLLCSELEIDDFFDITVKTDLLSPTEVFAILNQSNFNQHAVEFFPGQIISFADITAAKRPGLLEALRRPQLLIAMLKSAQPVDELMAHRSEPEMYKDLRHYQTTEIRVETPVYDLLTLCANKMFKRIRLLSSQKELLERLNKDTKQKNWKYSEKEKWFYINLTEEGSILHVKILSPNDLTKVIAVKIDELNMTVIPGIRPVSFNASNSVECSAENLLLRSSYPRRTLLSVDYGSGKSTLLLHLFQLGLGKPSSKQYEWVFVIKLSQIVQKVFKKTGLADIVSSQAKKLKLCSEDFNLWQKEVIALAISHGHGSLLLDEWDQLSETHAELVNDWIDTLPKAAHIIIATRPNPKNKISLSVFEKISLPVLSWNKIKNIIVSYFDVCFYGNNFGVESTQQANKFIHQIFKWLQFGNNKEIIDILQRPLHTMLLCDALKPHYQEYMAADTDETREEVERNAPWHGQAFYRTKLYQLIVMQQLCSYIKNHVKAQTSVYVASEQHVNMLTQMLQIRLREVAFKEIFSCEPIVLCHYLDTQALDQELHDLGFVTTYVDEETKKHNIEFPYRIFVEYFAAAYLLVGLTRSPGDFYFEQARKIVDAEHYKPAYEQIWRILGEMIRYGEPLLNFSALGKDVDVLSHMPAQFSDGDLVGSHRRFFYNCLNGLSYSNSVKLKKYVFEVIDDENVEVSQDKDDFSSYTQKTPEELLQLAKKSKNTASHIVKYLLDAKKLTDSWLKYFYSSDDLKDKHLALDKALPQTLAMLKQCIETCDWPGPGGYWDVDAYFPAIKFMRPKLFLMGAAYFIHRIENRNNRHYSSGVSVCVDGIIGKLIYAEFDQTSNRFFLMMIQSWLRQPYIVNVQTYIPLAAFVKKAWQCFEKDIEYRWLGIDVLFSLGFVFRVLFLNDEKSNSLMLIIQNPSMDQPIELKFSSEQDKTYFLKRFAYLREKSDFLNMQLPDIAWDAKEFEQQLSVTPKLAALISAQNSPTHSGKPSDAVGVSQQVAKR